MDVIVLDTLGMVCPQPIIEIAQKIKELAIGQTIEIWSDDPVICLDLPAWCESTGHKLTHETHENEVIKIKVVKK